MLKSASGQIKLFTQEVPIEKSLQDPILSEEQKSQITLALAAKKFAEDKVGLAKTKNYTKFVRLDRPALSYVVNAAPKWELKNHLWSFPFSGEVPYKGYFDEADAKEEAQNLQQKDLDTYVRGVSAYSLLGWFADPLYSSMLRGKPYDLVNTIIHETVHATAYKKGKSDFNERLASFIADQATEVFYQEKEGPNSPTVQQIRAENHDQSLFSKFITAEISSLKEWYKSNTQHQEELRIARLNEIKERFQKELKPQLKTDLYDRFPQIELNNARLMLYRTYVSDLVDYEIVFKKLEKDFPQMVRVAKHLVKASDPDKELKTLATLPTQEIFDLLKKEGL